MGKKRKDRNPKEESSVDLSGATCTHIRKGIDHSLLKKISLDKPWSSCQTCQAEKEKDSGSGGGSGGGSDDTQPETESSPEGPAVWMCLKCGHRGCGRSSENQHAVKHYETPRSDTHCLVLSLDNWSVWCYICDDDVHYSSTGQLAQLVSNIKKQALVDSSHKTSSGKAKEEEDAVLEVPVEKEAQEAEKEPEDPPKQREHKKASKQNGVLKKEAAAGAGCGAVAVKGFSNLGNTCFFNAVLQNLSQTSLLRRLLGEVKDEQSSLLLAPPPSAQLDPLQVQLPRPGSLTLAMCQHLNEVQQTQKAVVTPRELFTQVCKKAPRFKGFQQQDSQELLRYLLDGMRAEESTRVTAGILEALKNSGKSLDAEQKKVAKEYEKNGGTRNLVDRVFGGEMTSTVMCKECKTVSLVTEVFLDLSLPVADEAYKKKNQKKGLQQKSSVSEDDDGDRDRATPLANGDENMPTGTGSKYQQKKAKKQAKKQAKNQRRQQKQGAKLTLDSLITQEAPPLSTDEQVEASGEGETDQARSQSGTSDSADQEKPAADDEKKEEEEEEEESKESCERDAGSNVNRYSALTEKEGADADVERDGGEEEEDEGGELSVPLKEEDGLAEGVEALSLQAANEESVEEEQEDKASGDEKGDPVEYVVVNQDPELAFHTLASRAAPHKQECSVESCLYQFTEVEQLTQSNSLLCVTCTKRQAASDGCKKNVYRDALKQMLISSPPPVLTLHLKRFQQVGYSVCKVNRHVQFPHLLDLAPFCSTNCKGVEEGEEQVLYSLYGIVEHSGTMRSGHYTAFVKTRPQNHTTLLNGAAAPGEMAPPKGSWFHISDSNVQPVTEAKVQSAQAYLLFYERIS